jgi:hypothetical protein
MSRDMVPINMRDPFMKDPFFSSTWEEFDKIKHEMMEKSKNFWEKVDKVTILFFAFLDVTKFLSIHSKCCNLGS